jgi:hypothetical protein
MTREHPIETARRALREAAITETDPHWAGLCERFAKALPPRAPMVPLPDGVVSLLAARRPT